MSTMSLRQVATQYHALSGTALAFHGVPSESAVLYLKSQGFLFFRRGFTVPATEENAAFLAQVNGAKYVAQGDSRAIYSPLLWGHSAAAKAGTRAITPSFLRGLEKALTGEKDPIQKQGGKENLREEDHGKVNNRKVKSSDVRPAAIPLPREKTHALLGEKAIVVAPARVGRRTKAEETAEAVAQVRAQYEAREKVLRNALEAARAALESTIPTVAL